MAQSAAEYLNARPVADRLKLIEALWDSIEAETSDPLPFPDWRRSEIDRRLDSLDAGSSVGTVWAEVKRENCPRVVTATIIVQPEAETDLAAA
jgi:putative addiction module component (TIGR02574 family)